MPFRDHSITPDDPRSPASPFAPAQPAAGVVAADVPDEQNLAGGPKPDEVSESTVSGYLAETNNGGPGTVDAPAGEPVQDSGSEDFDPSQSSVAQVNAYLDTASDDERERVLSAERAGQNRKGIVG